MKPRLAFTMGDPAGVGPEVAIKAAQTLSSECEITLIGMASACSEAMDLLGADSAVAGFRDTGPDSPTFPKCRDSAVGGRAAWNALQEAVSLAMSGEVDGIVTAPLSKASLHMAGHRENGHTEILARETRTEHHSLCLWSEEIVCAFVTCHMALREVPGKLTPQSIVSVAELLDSFLRRLSIPNPKLCLPALNPHAGENNIFGDEDSLVLVPAVEEARDRGIHLEGPVPADTAFLESRRKQFDGYVALYHDQGGIPFKMLAFDSGVNTTLGLPIIRTSVTHGTAYDAAWKGTARPDSMISAARLAMRLARCR